MLEIDKREVLRNLPTSIHGSSRIDRDDGFGIPNYTKKTPNGPIMCQPIKVLETKKKYNSEIVAKGPNVSHT